MLEWGFPSRRLSLIVTYKVRVPSAFFFPGAFLARFLATGFSSSSSSSSADSSSGFTSSILAVDSLLTFLADGVVFFLSSLSPVSDFLARALFAGVFFVSASSSSARTAVDFRFLMDFAGVGSLISSSLPSSSSSSAAFFFFGVFFLGDSLGLGPSSSTTR